MEQPHLGFSIAEEKNQTVLRTKQVKKLVAPSAPSNLFPNLLPNLSPDLSVPNLWEQKRLFILNKVVPHHKKVNLDRAKVPSFLKRKLGRVDLDEIKSQSELTTIYLTSLYLFLFCSN